MGLFALKLAVCVSVLTSLLSLVACLLIPFHELIFFVATAVPVFAVETYLLHVGVEFFPPGHWACKKMSDDNLDVCGKLEGATDLHRVASVFCQLRGVVPGLCDGFESAHMGGSILLLAMLLMLIGFGSAGWCAQLYVQKPKRRYRELAFSFSLGAVVIHALALMFYSIFVLAKLESIRATNIILFYLISPGSTLGIKWGAWWNFVLVIFNIAIVVLYYNGMLKEEEILEEVRAQQQFEQEYFAANANQAAAGSYADSPYAIGSSYGSSYGTGGEVQQRGDGFGSGYGGEGSTYGYGSSYGGPPPAAVVYTSETTVVQSSAQPWLPPPPGPGMMTRI